MHYKNNEVSIFLKLGTTLGIGAFLLITWLFIAKVDTVAVTTGKIIPDGKNQNISVLETSSIEQILVTEGQLVKKGQRVALLDNTNMNANLKQVSEELELSLIKERAIETYLNNKSFIQQNGEDILKFKQIESDLNSKKMTYESNQLNIQAEILQAKNEMMSNATNLEKLKKAKSSWENQYKVYSDLINTGAVSKIEATEKMREAEDKIAEIEVQKQLLLASEAKVKQSQIKLQISTNDYKQQLYKEKTDLMLKIQSLKQEQVKAKHNINVRVLTSPVDGIVKDIVTNSPQSVLNEGNTLMTIVPVNDTLKADVIVKNTDIGYLEEGQKVKLKLETFAFQKYGLIEGKIEKISPDSTEDKETKQNNYHVIITLDKNYLEKDDKKYMVKIGMVVNADIIISRRTIFEYLTSPLQKTILESARER